MKAIALIAVAALATASALATDKPKKAYSSHNFNLSVGVGFPTADTKDAGVSTMFMGALDMDLGMMGDGTSATSFVGVGGMWGSGDADFKTTSYGIHYGVVFGLGDANASMPLAVKVKGGYYNTKLTGPVDENKWGFGGSAALVWMGNKKGGFTIEGGYYFMPSVSGMNNTGWYAAVGIPLNSK